MAKYFLPEINIIWIKINTVEINYWLNYFIINGQFIQYIIKIYNKIIHITKINIPANV